jgi:hypothetical protein
MKLPHVRVSVRWLMALVLTVGGSLGWYIRGVRLQAAAVAAVNRAHGHVGYEWEFKDDQPDPRGKPWAPDWLVKRVGLDCVGSVVSVGLYQEGTDADLVAIGNLGRLRSLNIIKARMTDAGLANLSGTSGLRSLSLSGMPITDAGLGHLTLTRLRWLILQEVLITDASLRRLDGLTGLEYLGLSGTGVTDAGLVQLRGLTGLTGLALENTRVTDAGLAHLKGLTKLKDLWLGGSLVRPEGVRDLRRSLPQQVDIHGVP